ncbi:MAG: class I SAM-dependent methyltransferase, partial [Pseudomonadota bacterium]
GVFTVGVEDRAAAASGVYRDAETMPDPELTADTLSTLQARLKPSRQPIAASDWHDGASARATQLHLGSGEMLAALHGEAPDAPADLALAARLHRTLELAAYAIFGRETDAQLLLRGVGRFRPPAMTGRLWVHARLRDGPLDTIRPRLDIRYYDGDGVPCGHALAIDLHVLTKHAQDSWLHRVAWHVSGRARQPDPATLRLPIASHDSILRDLSVYHTLKPELDRICRSYLRAARPAIAQAHRSTAPWLRHAAAHFEQVLGDHGEAQAASFAGVLPPQGDIAPALDALAMAYPQCADELELLRYCGEQLPSTLSGERSALEVLHSGKAPVPLDRIYRESAFSRACNQMIVEMLEQILRQQSSERPIRLLEVGGGTGGLTQALLPVATRLGVEYVFSDVSRHALARAREQYPSIQVQLLDLERTPDEQDLAGERFDIVVGTNVLHAVADLSASLQFVRQMMAPDGWLISLEGTINRLWADVTFGLTQGWWKFAGVDSSRDYPLMDAASWRARLADAGFSTSTIFPSREDEHALELPLVVTASRSQERALAPSPVLAISD